MVWDERAVCIDVTLFTAILVTTMPPWEAPSTLKLVFNFSSEWQSPAQVVQIVQMLLWQMQQTLRPEVQVTDVTGPSDTTGNRARG
jgi:hypothetical protein